MNISIVEVNPSLTSPSFLSPHVSLVSMHSTSNRKEKEEKKEGISVVNEIKDEIKQLVDMDCHKEVIRWWGIKSNKLLYKKVEELYNYHQELYLNDPGQETFDDIRNIALKILPYWFEIQKNKSIPKDTLLYRVSRGNLQRHGSKKIPLLVFLTSMEFLQMESNSENEISEDSENEIMKEKFPSVDWKTYFTNFPAPQWIKKLHEKNLVIINGKHQVVLEDMMEVVVTNLGNFLYKPSKENLAYAQKNMFLLTAFTEWEKRNPASRFREKNINFAKKITQIYQFIIMPPLFDEVEKNKQVAQYLESASFYFTNSWTITREYEEKKSKVSNENEWIPLQNPLSLTEKICQDVSFYANTYFDRFKQWQSLESF